MEHFANPSLSVVVAKCCFFMVCGVRQNLYVFSLYRNIDLDDRIFHYLLTSMAAVQAEDERASFLFVGDLNGHHQEWLGSATTNRQCCSLWLCNYVWLRPVGCRPDHALGGTLDLLMTVVPDLVRVFVVAPIGNSDHS